MAWFFDAEVVYWRGPAPFLFARLPTDVASSLHALGSAISYGWGCIPVEARIGEIEFTTALIPREGTYLLPLKVAVRKKLPSLEVGDRLAIEMRVAAPTRL